ncbi:MAG: BNR repeat-containing protein [Tannerellaceae bacterium]|nr:BNR repeat-containing protein [Tannerellaceae bacterium]
MQFVAFYDSAHVMTVASRALDAGTWDYQTLDSKVGWDSHNGVVVKVDAKGYIHVSGNMHGSPLCYYRSTNPLDIHSLQRISRMTDTEEDCCVTYPVFMDGPNGEFIFHYRYGGSGNGYEIFKVWDVERQIWKPLINKPLLDGEGERSAYMHGPVAGPDGYYHLIWVWRDTPDCATNHTLSYARSRDLVHWESIQAKEVQLPMTFGMEELYVDATPPGGGLFNPGIRLGFDCEGKVIITYHKYDDRNNTQLFISRYENGNWNNKQVTEWDFPWHFQGNGSVAVELTIDSPKPLPNGQISFGYHRKDIGDKEILIDSKTLIPVGEQPYTYGYPEVINTVESSYPEMMVNKCYDASKRPNENALYMLRWETLPPNRDSKRAGDLPAPSILRLYKIYN